MTTALPTALDPILRDPDPEARVRALTAYLERVDQQASRARQARLAAVVELRARPMTWRALSDLSGLAEQYLRQMVRNAP